jgi:putative sugar O-methyltransferase
MKILSRFLSTTKPQAEPGQVADDPALLKTMMKDLDNSDPMYQPGPYWKKYEGPFVEYLLNHGLKNFRDGVGARGEARRTFKSFGAGDSLVAPPEGKTMEEWRQQRFDFVSSYGALHGAKPLSEVSVSSIGKPADLFQINGNNYTTMALLYYMRYAYVSHFVDFDNIQVMVELGMGSGKQTEIIHQLHPNLTTFLFDIPPQTYICNQFLSAIMGDRVVPFEETRKMKSLKNIEPGKIYIFGSWQYPLIKDLKVDLFWNAASFQEMEPDLVENYLSFVRENTEYVYLMERMAGTNVRLEHYEKSLHNFRKVDLTPHIYTNGMTDPIHSNSFWQRMPKTVK